MTDRRREGSIEVVAGQLKPVRREQHQKSLEANTESQTNKERKRREEQLRELDVRLRQRSNKLATL